MAVCPFVKVPTTIILYILGQTVVATCTAPVDESIEIPVGRVSPDCCTPVNVKAGVVVPQVAKAENPVTGNVLAIPGV